MELYDLAETINKADGAYHRLDKQIITRAWAVLLDADIDTDEPYTSGAYLYIPIRLRRHDFWMLFCYIGVTDEWRLYYANDELLKRGVVTSIPGYIAACAPLLHALAKYFDTWHSKLGRGE
jgi:hypothetical protein